METDPSELSPRATALAVLTLVGLSVLPALHLLVHDQLEPHTHGPAASHCHGAECHEHRGERARDRTDERSDEAPEPDHGGGSLAHQDLALAIAPPALGLAGASRLAAPSVLPAPRALPDRAHDAPLRARGPPASS